MEDIPFLPSNSLVYQFFDQELKRIEDSINALRDQFPNYVNTSEFYSLRNNLNAAKENVANLKKASKITFTENSIQTNLSLKEILAQLSDIEWEYIFNPKIQKYVA